MSNTETVLSIEKQVEQLIDRYMTVIPQLPSARHRQRLRVRTIGFIGDCLARRKQREVSITDKDAYTITLTKDRFDITFNDPNLPRLMGSIA